MPGEPNLCKASTVGLTAADTRLVCGGAIYCPFRSVQKIVDVRVVMCYTLFLSNRKLFDKKFEAC